MRQLVWAASREGLSDPLGRLLLPEAEVEAIGQFAKSPALRLDSGVAVGLGGRGWPLAWGSDQPGRGTGWGLAKRPRGFWQ